MLSRVGIAPNITMKLACVNVYPGKTATGRALQLPLQLGPEVLRIGHVSPRFPLKLYAAIGECDRLSASVEAWIERV